jgi:TonB-linked SusC/RagA family outer membrane protein
MQNALRTAAVRRVSQCWLVPLVLCIPIGAASGAASADELRHNSNFINKSYLLNALSKPQIADITVQGTVTDDKGEALPGVNVLQKGTSNGTQTNTDGKFTIKVPDQGAVLVFSFVGYKSQEVPASSAGAISVKLVSDSQSLDDVVVVGYGTQSQRTVTGAVGVVKSEDLTRTPASAATSALVGRVPGVTARQADARPGNGTTVQIRNMGTPLYVIDGVVSDEGSFNNLGLDDIDNISILKDASAAIYGLRAANGVVLVTTKRGQRGAPVIRLSGYYGVQNFTRYPHPANAYQYERALVESDQNQGRKSNITPEELEKWRVGTEPGYQSFDYYKMVMRPNVPQYNANLSVSGGSESVKYYLSVSQLGQEALIRDYKFNRTNVQANVEAGLSKRLRVGAQISGRIEDRSNVGVPGVDDYFNPFLSIFSMWPTEHPYANDNPNYINQTHNINVNPATYKKDVSGYAQDYWRAFKTNLTAQYDFDFGLTLKAIGSYTFTNNDFNTFEYTYNAYKYDAATNTYNTDPSFGNQNPYRESHRRNVIDRYGQLQASYTHQFGDHGVSGVLAYERYDTDNRYNAIVSVPPNNTIPIQLFASQNTLVDEIRPSARAGYISRLNYNYKQKYLFEVLGRYDGSFLFAPGNRYGFFPGTSLGWRLSEEPFIKDHVGTVLSELKLRASYGRTGSDVITYGGINNDYIVAPFSYLSGYNFPAGSAIFNGNYVFGVQPRGLPITTLSWVKNSTANVGVDVGFFENRLTGQFDVFERRRSGLPAARYDVVLPSEVGYGLPQDNLNSDAIRGLEGALTYANAVGGFTYSVTANATLARSRDLSTYKPRFGNSIDQYRNSTQDRWSNINWGYQVTGQFQSQQQIADYKVDNDGQGNRTQLPGDFIYEDVNGDGIINYLDERPLGYALGATPYFNYAFSTTLGYKNFTLRVDLVGAQQQTYRRDVELRIPFQNNGVSPTYVFEDRWHHEDPFNSDSPWVPGTYPAIRKDNPGQANYNRNNSFWLTNVHYLRVRNVELGYNFPKALVSRFGIGALRVYVNGTNLYSFDNVKQFGIDPEISSEGGLVYPPQRLFNTGLSVSF